MHKKSDCDRIKASRLNTILTLVQANEMPQAYKLYHAEKLPIWDYFNHVLKTAQLEGTKSQRLGKELDSFFSAVARCMDFALPRDENINHRHYYSLELIKLTYHYLSCCYFMKRHPMPGTWASLHKCFYDLRTNQHPQYFETQYTIYQKCLMLALFHPFEADNKVFNELYYLIDNLVSYIQVSKATDKTPHQFYIDIRSDNPMTYYRDISAVDYQLLAIDLIDLTKLLKNKVQQRRNYLFNRQFNNIHLSKISAMYLLDIIVNHKIRQSQRNYTHVECNISTNFSDTWHKLHQGAHTSSVATIINKSDGGICISIKNISSTSYTAGQIVGINENDHPDFMIGMIKWVKDLGNNIVLGVEKIALNPKAIKTKIDSLNFNDALSFTFLSNQLSLLTPLYPFRTGQTVSLKDDLVGTQPGQDKQYLLGKGYTVGKFKIFELIYPN